jgi:hypothetical protein
VNVFVPLKASVPTAVFTNEPPPAITPLNAPSTSVNAVLFKFNVPAPFNVAIVCAPVVNVATRSGSNELHGSVFYFARNGAMNARNYFAAQADNLKRNQFGATLGGPILKNKLFFLGSFQNTIIRNESFTNQATVPNAAFRGGNFSSLLPGTLIRDPLHSNTPFPGNIIPAASLRPIAHLRPSAFLRPSACVGARLGRSGGALLRRVVLGRGVDCEPRLGVGAREVLERAADSGALARQ